MAEHGNDLWRDFPKTAIEFDERFQTEEACLSASVRLNRGHLRMLGIGGFLE